MEGGVMGDRHHDPTDHFRTTQPHAGITMKDNLYWPGFILLAVGVGGMISTTVAAAYRHHEWLATTGLVAALGVVAGALWFVVESRRVARIDQQWHVDANVLAAPTRRVASKEVTGST
jgi:uncharacterized membrane protein YcjF (UPF0283 family)